MTNTKMIQEYLLWKRDKELYPPQWTPDEWAKDVLMSEAYARIDMIKRLYESLDNGKDIDPMWFSNEICRITYDPLEELLNGGLQVQEETEGDSLLEWA